MKKLAQVEIPIPSIGAVRPDQVEDMDWDDDEMDRQENWLRAAKKAQKAAKKGLPKASTWWGADSPLLRDLDAYRLSRSR